MKAQKFELFLGRLGNGITVCNKAVMEHGDYKDIAHISPIGSITWYVSNDYCPVEAVETIKKHASDERKKYLQWWNAISDASKYERMMDELPWTIINPYLLGDEKKSLTMKEKIAELEVEYFKM